MTTADQQLPQEVHSLAVDGTKFYGIVASSHGTFCYIKDVKRGYESLNTNGDIFCPKNFEVGASVEFLSLHSDPKREGKFRTEDAQEVTGALIRVSSTKALIAVSRAEVVKQLTEKSAYHKTLIKLTEQQKEEVDKNQPFSSLFESAVHAGMQNISPKDFLEQQLQEIFHSLLDHGVVIALEGYNVQQEEASLLEYIITCEKTGMKKQALQVVKEYTALKHVREIFAQIFQAGALTDYSRIIPASELQTLLVTMPVWFLRSCQSQSQVTAGYIKDNSLLNIFNKKPPVPSLGRVQRNSYQSEEFLQDMNFDATTLFFEMHNITMKSITHFDSREIMPRVINNSVEYAVRENVFDMLAITTTYLDLASKDWKTVHERSVDPMVIGQFRDIPYFFNLGKWSMTGLFSSHQEMIADTVTHLEMHMDALSNIDKSSHGFSYRDGEGKWQRSLPAEIARKKGYNETKETFFQRFARDFISAYKSGKMNAFLKSNYIPTVSEK